MYLIKNSSKSNARTTACEYPRRGGDRGVVLYGSGAKRTYHAKSDIDLPIKGDCITDSVIGKIEEEIDDLLLPYSFDISS